MKALAVTGYKAPLTVVDVAEPTVGRRDVLVRVEAAGLNHLDERIRSGEFKQILPYRTPFVLGHDVAGTVIETGSAVNDFHPGDPVYSRPRDGRIGTFAERIAIDESDVAPAPTSISIQEAGSLPLIALTAWQALVVRGRVRPGQKVLIHAGAGGVGSIAIQLAKHLGATVATTASRANTEFVSDLGADIVIDYYNQDFETELSGYDLVLDSLGGKNLDKSLRILAPGGTAIGIAGPPDPAFARQAGLNPFLRAVISVLSGRVRRRARRLGVTYEFLFVRSDGGQLREISSLIDSGAIRPGVVRPVPFLDGPAALSALGGRGRPGKAVLVGISDRLDR